VKRIHSPVAVFDTLSLVLVAAAAVIADTGGAVWHLGGLRVSGQNAWRPLAGAAAVLVVRLVVHGRVGPFGRRWREVGESFGWIEDLRRAARAPIPPARELALALLALTAATAVVFHAQVVDFHGVPDLGDPLFSMWRMAWVPHQLATDPRHLFDANIFYPASGTLTYSDSIILPALTAAPLLWAGVQPVVAYNLLFLSGFVLSAFALYVLARALSFGPPAAWMAAIIFGFYHYRLDHYSHLELQMAQWMPIALLAVHRLLATAKPRYIAVLMLAIGAQWYSSMYYGLFLMVYLAAFAGVLAIVWRPGWRPVAYVASGLALGVALAVPLARAYSASGPERGPRPVVEIRRFSALPVDYLQPSDRSAAYRSLRWRSHKAERALFPGVTPVVLAVLGAAPPLTATRLAVLLAGILAFDGSLGFNGHWYPMAHQALPFLTSVRAPARFAMFVGLSLALLSAAGVERWWGRLTSVAARRFALAVMTTAVLIEGSPALDLTPVWQSPPSLYATLGPESGAVLFEYPMRPDPDWFETNIPYMYFSIWHWTKMVNGYSGFIPRSYKVLAESTEGFPTGGTVDYLKKIGVTHVTVHCAFWDRPACALTMARLDGDPRFRLAAGTQWGGEPSRLYELAR
jgi:hypothetical protein